MCGITALYEPSAPTWLPAVTRAMTRLVRHRGPDGEGFAFYEPATGRLATDSSDETPEAARKSALPPGAWSLGLGHRRLSILDLSTAGHQPMADVAEDVWITFNGEIYNYRELRAELAALGHRFASDTDTEAIVAAWREWGEGCLPRFRGMFAFVLFDRRTGHLLIARDRFGIKPLYFWRTPGGGVAFASEIKQFTAHPQWRARLDGPRAYDFLNWGLTDHTQATLFAGVSQLRGGECIAAPLATLRSATPRTWYHLKATPFQGDFSAAAERFRTLLEDSVRIHLRADVPVGSCLSGGLDSSSLVCTMQAQLAGGSGRQNTFSAYSEVARFDERQFIADVVHATRVRAHHTTPTSAALLRELDALAWHQDEPFGSTSIYAQWCVFRQAREQGVLVMLDGQGADEALGGYHGYFGHRLAGLLRQGAWWQCWREAAAVRALHGQSKGDQVRLLLNSLLTPQVADRLRRLAGRTVRAPDFLDLAKLGAVARSPHDHAVDLREPVRSLSLAQLTSLNLPMLLHWEDRDSMAHGVEARVPFLDHPLVEFCLGLPEEHKLSGGWTKRVLREGMRGRLPESVRLRRDKLGFATAEEVWMRQQPEVFLRLVDEAISASGGILTRAARTKAERMLSNREPFRFYVWRLISFGAWLRRFDVALS